MSSPKPREAQSKGLKCAKKKNNHHNIENRRIKTERQKESRGREVDSLILDKDYFLSLLDHCCTSLFCGQLNVYRSPQGNLLHRSLPSNLLLLSEGSRSSFTESTIFKGYAQIVPSQWALVVQSSKGQARQSTSSLGASSLFFVAGSCLFGTVQNAWSFYRRMVHGVFKS